MTFEEFVTRHQRDLVRFSTTLTNDRGLGEDLVQDILIRAQARWARIDQLDQPYTYVRRMLVNEFVSWRRVLRRVMRDSPPPPDARQWSGSASLGATFPWGVGAERGRDWRWLSCRWWSNAWTLFGRFSVARPWSR